MDFSAPHHFSDVVLVVEGTKFHVHRSTLSMWSPVFEKMFTSDFSERNAKEIPLPGKRADEVKVLLNLIYSGAQQEVTDANRQFLLELAEEYQMEKVKELCVQFLDKSIDPSNCIRRCNLADRFGLEGLMSKCMESASHSPYDRLEAIDEYKEMRPHVKLEICKKRIIELEKASAEYVAICSKHVAEAYQVFADKALMDVECDRKKEHPENEKFHHLCECCMRRLKNNVSYEVPSIHPKARLKKILQNLKHQDKVVEELKSRAHALGIK